MKERQLYCLICKRVTQHVIAFYNSPIGWNCAEHKDLEHCCKCGKEISEEAKRVAKHLGADHVICDGCTPIGGTFA